jgi:membrane-associated phospholipid phosphatase
MRHTRKAILVPIALAAAFSCAAPVARAESPYELNHSQEWVWVGTGLSLCVGGLWASHRVDPLTPQEIQALDTGNINSFDRNTMQPYRDDHAGDALALTSFLVPIAFLSNDDMRADAATLGTMWAEAALWSEGLAQVTKSIAKRARPYAYDPNAPAELKTQTEARLSFYSAHATGAAMNCFFMAKVFSDYSSNHAAEAAMWTGAILYPALTGFFRVDSGHHFSTDAIVGVITGAAVGYLVPALHHRSDSGVNVEPQSNSGGVGFTATFSF